jgi:hypothetical protein
MWLLDPQVCGKQTDLTGSGASGPPGGTESVAEPMSTAKAESGVPSCVQWWL